MKPILSADVMLPVNNHDKNIVSQVPITLQVMPLTTLRKCSSFIGGKSKNIKSIKQLDFILSLKYPHQMISYKGKER